MIGKERQTMADVALIGCGTMESVFALMRKHGKGITESVCGFDFGTIQPANRHVVDFYAMNQCSPATQSDEQEIIP